TVTVGAYDQGVRTTGLVARRPVYRRLQHDLFGRLALRAIEPGGPLGFAEDIHYAVITDPVTRAEVAMSVVVERAPGDAARVLRIGGELIVDTRVPERVLHQPVSVVYRLGVVSVADEFSVQISWVVRRLKWEAEVVYREDVFEQLR